MRGILFIHELRLGAETRERATPLSVELDDLAHISTVSVNLALRLQKCISRRPLFLSGV